MAVPDTALAWCLGHLGIPYDWGSHVVNGQQRYDCSGFVRAGYAAAGVTLTGSTYSLVGEGTKISGPTSWAAILPKLNNGDLIFPDPGHVQMYAGGGTITEAPQTGSFTQHVPEWATAIYAVVRIASGGGSGVTPSGAGSPSTPVATTSGSGLSVLIQASTWERVGYVIGGLILLGLGVYILTQNTAAGKAVAKGVGSFGN